MDFIGHVMKIDLAIPKVTLLRMRISLIMTYREN